MRILIINLLRLIEIGRISGLNKNDLNYAIDFLNIVYIVDNDVPVDTFVNWYWFCAEYEQCKINLQNYFKLESDYKAEKIKLGLKENDIMNDFEPYLIYLLLKKND